MTFPLIDTHCHFEEGDDVSALLKEAQAHQVAVLAVGGNPELNATASSSGTWFAQGFDWSVAQPDFQALRPLPGRVAIGELGFDLHYTSGAEEEKRQTESFRYQAALASESDLPIILHTREADRLTLENLRTVNLPRTGVIHSFTGEREFAYQLLDLGFYISFSGILTFRNATPLREVAKALPLNRLLVETDSPYLAPVPLRGKRNCPANVRYVAECLASVRGCTVEEIARATTENACALFNLPSPTPEESHA